MVWKAYRRRLAAKKRGSVDPNRPTPGWATLTLPDYERLLVIRPQRKRRSLGTRQAHYFSGRAKYKELRSVKISAPTPMKTAVSPRLPVNQL